jgi:alkanesulfonate monooxygenase SsuD/methylene tetrahydromethanopterin reductase-like flavin-dependent oxidoreductase (luciferase family)
MLRGLERLIAGRDPDGLPARDALPHPDGGIVRLKAPVLPDPKEGPPAYLGAGYGPATGRALGRMADAASNRPRSL